MEAANLLPFLLISIPIDFLINTLNRGNHIIPKNDQLQVDDLCARILRHHH
jgi:hypothetical protein